jgi:hypothetical protein
LDAKVPTLTRRFIVRDFEFDENALEKQNKELVELAEQEKELWVSWHSAGAYRSAVRQTRITRTGLAAFCAGGLPSLCDTLKQALLSSLLPPSPNNSPRDP